MAEPGHCREVRFLKDDLLQVRHAGNSVSYVDLRNGRCYSVRPRVLRYGSIELLQVNRTYYSRTRQVYANTCGLPSSSIVWMGFYVKMYDGRVPSRCRRMEDGGFCCEPQVCLLEGDEERAYYLSGWLPDQSIVVMDEEGRYYHVEKGHGKRYVACYRPSDRSEDFDEAVALLRRQADERVEKRLREEKCEYERKRQRIISRSVEAVPFQIGVNGAEDSGADFDSTCLSEDIASGGWLLRLSGQLLPVGGTGCRRKDHYPGPVYGGGDRQGWNGASYFGSGEDGNGEADGLIG